ncbi:14073_t:CDS:2 [Rhizophagus irregularis]|nr:14073_t:CDS:2 [Rhizophagus irregularis]
MPIYISSLSILELEGPSFTISLTAVFSSPANMTYKLQFQSDYQLLL